MKKAFSILYKLVIISVVLQTLGYFFIDSFYFGDRTNLGSKIKITQVSTAGFGQNSKGINVKGIPDSASDIQVSYDMSYASYMDNGKLVIVDSSTGKTATTIENAFPTSEGEANSNGQKANIDCYKWYSDRNTILYMLSALESSPGKVQLMTYDVSAGNTQIGKDITNISRGSRVTDVTFSSLNMTAFISVKTSSSQAKVYRTNIMSNVLSPFTLPINSVLKNGYYTDNLLYQNNRNQIFIRKGVNSARQINLKKKASLINVLGDSSTGKDIAYIGELDNGGKVNNIIYGDIDTEPSRWTSMALKGSCDAKDIIVKDSGVYQVSEGEKVLKKVNDGKEAKYEGKFIDVIGDQVVYIDNGTIKSKSL